MDGQLDGWMDRDRCGYILIYFDIRNRVLLFLYYSDLYFYLRLERMKDGGRGQVGLAQLCI